ncbi:conjugal transfer protein TraG N-terminal domain-containing protein [Pseudomonas bubulae]|uniref:conjugal transfer protein TraG N-terminal domain-containing protein n=1 Tax=Pseudomonas bubulae TaxID=2316085 RepID=UPI002B1D8A13|nr:conjugal transfer protein TraG N-terminal domain-containing protein [Pseudomonas bubulae]
MWEIYAYQNADSLFGIFNAAAAIHGSSDYRAAIAAVAFCGFVAALVAYAFAPEKMQGWTWLGSVLLVFSLMIVPKVTVGIVDKTGSAPVKVVANVPLGIAALASLTSTVGHTLTGLFETAFQVIPEPGALPEQLTYQKNGLLFGHRLIRETRKVVFQDTRFRTDLINYLDNCTRFDLMDGSLDPRVFNRSDNVWDLLGNSNPARFSTLTRDGLVDIATCPQVYANLSQRLPAEVQRIEGRLAFALNPTLPGPVAAGVIAPQIQQAYLKNRIATASATAASIIRQNAVLNAIEDSAKISGQKANDPAAMVLAVGRAQAVAQQNAAWLNAGKIAEQTLPMMRNIIEALMYALFPILVLLMLLTGGRETLLVFKGYISVLIWIQLWPPLYAVLNYMATIYAAYDLAAAADLGGGLKGLTLQTASTVYSRSISGEAIVGYMVLSIPLIAWAAVKRMDHLGMALVGGLSGLQGMLTGTSAAAAGNTSLGNVGMDQVHLAPNRSSAFMSTWQNDLSGNTFSANALTGRMAASLLRNQGFASRVVSAKVSENDVSEASRQVDAAYSESVTANRERAAVLTEAFSRGLTTLKSGRHSTGTSASSFEQTGQSLSQLDQISQNIARNTGLSQAQVANIAFGAAGHVSVKTTMAGLQANASAEKLYQSTLTGQEQKALSSLSQEQVNAFKQFGDQISQDASYSNLVSSDTREAHDLSTRLAMSTTRSEQTQANLSDRASYAERVSAAYEKGDAIAIDMAQDPHNMEMFMRYSEQYGRNSAAAHVMMDAELARQGLSPNRVFSDGSALPYSFEDMRDRHQFNRSADSLNQDPASTFNKHRQTMPNEVSTEQPVAPASSVRSDIQERGSQIRRQTQSDQSKFEQNADIIETDDGTLASRKSQLGQAGKQVGKDAQSSFGDAKDAVKDLFKK